ncbi:MAG: COG0553: Superfamily II DNA/RNA helicases, SNF2 family [uncultured Thiotrichaceae bacterium]|uniref:COG0553: Superfamily II DNA/RNA helicases, SNF2 family n=1 Tax=uncultured Thiotrichaceae bacterium TaxID=298394 RepID=A0A6S6STH4_9GAMM|nr:MAG: COG0553: Superfamily II DNA/RNA helicases, SNF2 family [uncultured Thiotrichaceae bacterium]
MNNEQKDILAFFDIDAQDLYESFGQRTVQRGLTYHNKGQVIELRDLQLADQSTSDFVATGIVKGSNAQVYETRVLISNGYRGLELSSNCSCPVGYNCKHGIAVFFTFGGMIQKAAAGDIPDDLKEEAEDQAIEQWFESLKDLDKLESSGIQSTEAALQEKKGITHHVVYILEYYQGQYNQEEGLSVKPVKARVLKKGGYGQIYGLSSYDISPYSYNNHLYYDHRDEEIVEYLEHLNSVNYDRIHQYILKGEVGSLMLKQILRTGRCFWESQKTAPLSYAEPRTIELEWTEDDGYCMPRLFTEPAFQHLFHVNDVFYVDKKNAQMGTAKHAHLTNNQLFAMLSVPPVPVKKAKAFSKKLLTEMPEVDFPLPEKLEVEVKDIEGVAPIFCLTIQAMDQEEVYPDWVHAPSQKVTLVRLHFDYAGQSVKPHLLTSLDKTLRIQLKDNVRYRIQRELPKEQEALSRMQAEGLKPVESRNPNLGITDYVLSGQQDNSEQNILRWATFFEETVAQLQAEGWQVKFAEDFTFSLDTIDDWHAEIEESEDNQWFEMNLGFELNGQRMNLLPMLVQLLKENPDKQALHENLKNKPHQLFKIDDAQWVKIPTTRILQILDTIIELYDTDTLSDGSLKYSKYAALHLNELLNDPSMRWKGADELRVLNNKLRDFDGIQPAELPKGLHAELRDYQKLGLDWLQFLRQYQFNGVLADDMGLGKTLQILSNLLLEKEQGRAEHPNLVIAPTSLMSNWKNEAKRFTPALKVLVLQGAKRKEHVEKIPDYDVVLTTYPLMIRDKDIYKEQNFHYLVLDEAQAIKNAKSKTTQIIYELKAQHRVCVTGTPMENHLGEIWSMYHFLMPGYLGAHDRFTRLFRTPIEKNGDHDRGKQLQTRIRPFLLRRTKELVATELPDKTEIVRTVSITGKQRDLYETVRVAMDKKVRDAVSEKGFARSQIMILDALLKLRQVCCDPQLVKLDKARKVKSSAKMELLMTLVSEMVSEGRKILIFSQFTSMLSIIEKALKKEKISTTKLTGQTRKREEAIAAFQEGDARVFLISLKAGGVGLNLTAADTVIHYDPWWNPAVEKQATDRAYRIGQDKPVFVYKLLTEETVEEKILQMQERKQALAEGLYGEKQADKSSLDQSDLLELLKPLDE